MNEPASNQIRTLAQILCQRPELRHIEHAAEITDSTDQAWSYWVKRLGAEQVIRCCRAKVEVGKKRTAFALAHEAMIEFVQQQTTEYN